MAHIYNEQYCPQCPATLICAAQIRMVIVRCRTCAKFVAVGIDIPLPEGTQLTESTRNFLDNVLGRAVNECKERYEDHKFEEQHVARLATRLGFPGYPSPRANTVDGACAACARSAAGIPSP